MRCTASAIGFPASCWPAGDTSDHGGRVENLRHAVFHAAATTDPALRQAAATGENLTEPWQSYTALVRDASYRVTDADVTRLVSAGHPEDEIFELTVAAAVGAALRGFDAGIRSAGELR